MGVMNNESVDEYDSHSVGVYLVGKSSQKVGSPVLCHIVIKHFLLFCQCINLSVQHNSVARLKINRKVMLVKYLQCR